MYKNINSKKLIKDCPITFDYIDSKQRLNNFSIKKRFFSFLKIFAKAKNNNKNSINKVKINYEYNFTKTD